MNKIMKANAALGVLLILCVVLWFLAGCSVNPNHFVVTSKYVVIGEETKGMERIMCASVSTDLQAWSTSPTTLGDNEKLLVYAAGNTLQEVSFIEYHEVESVGLFSSELKKGLAIITTANSEIRESYSGSPLALASDPYNIIGVLSGGNSWSTTFIPLKFP